MGSLRPILEEALTVGAAVTQLPVANLLAVHEVEVLVQQGALRLRLDGTAPTATTGPLRERGYTRRLTRYEAAQARFIRDTDQTEDATVQATYYGAA